MNRFVLIRHGRTDVAGHRLTGRRPGVHLNDAGHAQAEYLPQRLRHVRLDAVYTSPRERARETAAPLARASDLEPTTLDALDELDYGDWQDETVDALEGDARWQAYNRLRSLYRIPDGDSLLETQLRMVGAVERLWSERPGATIALVGHGDPLRALIVYVLGMPLDFVLRLEIAPASVSMVELDEGGPRVTCLGCDGALPDPAG